MPPKLGQIRRGIAPARTEMMVARSAGDAVSLPMPLFWDSPPWHHWTPMVAACVFEAMRSRGVLVSALRSELGDRDSSGIQSDRHAQPERHDPPDHDRLLGEKTRRGSLRMLPYRNERYGMSSLDFDDVSVVDLQLSPPRDASGRIAYSPEQISRWEATTDDQPLSGGGWVPAMTLPPDVPSADHLRSKVDQLRVLCPQAAVIVSITPEWIDKCWPQLVAAGPDAILIRMSQMRIDGISLAKFTLRMIGTMESGHRIPVWLTPPKSMQSQSLSVSDSIKLIALGVSAIAINGWLDDLIDEIDEIPPPSSFDADPYAKTMITVDEVLQRLLDPQLEYFEGLYSSLVHDHPRELLGTFDPEIARQLNLPCVGQFD
ncbi:hypothetical protein [Neorhodopirellula pilleata]|nr:hypothetical protein [Neorhodopirellula pilleata]